MPDPFANTDLANIRWLIFKNTSGETIPSFGVIDCKAGDFDIIQDRFVIRAQKPTAYGSQYSHYINGMAPVVDGAYGVCSNTFPFPMAVDPGYSSLITHGDMIGPRAGSWLAREKTGGFRVIGVSDDPDTFWVEKWPMLSVKVKASTLITKGNQDSAAIVMWGNEGLETPVTGIKLPVYNRYADIAAGAIGRARLNQDSMNWEWTNANVC